MTLSRFQEIISFVKSGTKYFTPDFTILLMKNDKNMQNIIFGVHVNIQMTKRDGDKKGAQFKCKKGPVPDVPEQSNFTR